MFLLVYLISLLANLGMITLIRMDPQLHTPMCFFLSHLSFCDLCLSTAIGPKMLMDQFAKKKLIPFYGCALQLLVLYTFANSECLLLAVMAYDQKKAISSPLLYAVSMSSGVCSLLMAGVYLVGMADALIHTTLAFHYVSTSLVGRTVKRLSTIRETRVRALGWEDPLEKEMAIHSSTIAWKIPWTEEPGRLQSMGSQRVGHD